MNPEYKLVIIGGGAAGYFTALTAAEFCQGCRILIIEKTNKVLAKVKISGGGRCNVTNIISDPGILVKNYPRGEKELRGPFTQFTTSDTVEWFQKKGVILKTEDDGRIFPVSDDSQTIIDCFTGYAKKYSIDTAKPINITQIKRENNCWIISSNERNFSADCIAVCSGSSIPMWNILRKLGHKIVEPVPSLFTFNINDSRLNRLAGISVKNVRCSIKDSAQETEGPVLFTHWGLSGPAILKLSSASARELFEKKYKFNLIINWMPHLKRENITDIFYSRRSAKSKKRIYNDHFPELPSRLWESILRYLKIDENIKWIDISNRQIDLLTENLTSSEFSVIGKSTFKEEFVTAGGVDLREINFKTMESRLHKNLFFAGEVLNIDAFTGGFNFQAAWTTAWIAAKTISERIRG